MQPLVPLTHDSDIDRWKASYRDIIKLENQAKKCKRITFTRQCFTNWTNGCLFVLHQAPKRIFSLISAQKTSSLAMRARIKLGSLTSLMTHG